MMTRRTVTNGRRGVVLILACDSQTWWNPPGPEPPGAAPGRTPPHYNPSRGASDPHGPGRWWPPGPGGGWVTGPPHHRWVTPNPPLHLVTVERDGLVSVIEPPQCNRRAHTD